MSQARGQRRRGPCEGDLVWIKYGTDPFWPALVSEVRAETLDVLFIERDVGQDQYQLGTISRNAQRWREFGEGLKACQEEDPDFKRISDMQSLLRWIHARHRAHLSADAHQSILTQLGQTEDTLPALEIAEVAAVTATANETTDAIVTKAVAAALAAKRSAGCSQRTRVEESRSKRESDTKPPEDKGPPKKRASATKRVGLQEQEPPKKIARATNHHDLHDDLNNGYGSFLLCDANRSKTLLQFDADPSGSQVIRELQKAVNRITSEYEVDKLTQSGSDAITHALVEACHGDISRCLFAAGTYVVGDTSPLRWFSTSGANTRLLQDQGPAIYRGVLPTDEITQACRSQVVPLPYSIPDEMNDDDLLQMEQESLHHLATRLSLNAVSDRPSRALLIELILASNGAKLSERFLHRLCDVCKIWDVNLVIDEVLTSIRCNGEIMLACSRGLSGMFTHAVIGKWPGIGAVLRIKDWKQPPLPDSRGETTIAATWGASNVVHILNAKWEAIMDQVKTNRAKTCTALKDTVKAARERDRGAEAQCWGEGCLIFSNVHAQTGPWSCNQDYQLTAGRYLPRVHGDQDVVLPSRTLLRCDFRAEHQGHVNAMFRAWLLTGELTPGYKQLRLFGRMVTYTENFPRPWQGRDAVLGMEYPGRDNIFDATCLRRFLKDPACTQLDISTWVDQHKAQLYKQVRKGKKRKQNYFMMPVLQKYRQFLKNQQYANDSLLSQPSNLAALVQVTLHDANSTSVESDT